MDKLRENTRLFGYSVNRLIELVKIRPIIWDSTRPDFKSFNNNNKEKAWKEVYLELDEKYRLADEIGQTEIGMRITSKWRNLRDAFMRSCKKRAQDGKVKKYVYHDRLSFMLKLLITDDVDQSPSRRISLSSESTTENVTEGSMSFDDCSVDGQLMTAVKVEPDEEDYKYSAYTSVSEPKNYIYSNTESKDYSDSVPGKVKVEIDDEKPTCSNEEKSNLKRKEADFHDEHAEANSLKVIKLEMETQEQTIQREVDVEDPLNQREYYGPLNTNESGTSTGTRLENPGVSTTVEDQSFFNSIVSFVSDMSGDEKLEFRMAVLRLIHEMRLNRHMISKS